MNMTVSKAIKMSWAALAHPAVLVRFIIPVLFTAIISISLFFWGFPLISKELVPFLNSIAVISWVFSHLEWLGFSLINVFALLLFLMFIIFSTYFLLILLSSLILVPLLTPVIQKMYFPHLVEANELSWIMGFQNMFIGTLVYLGSVVIGIPLFFVPGGQLVYPFFLNSFITKRVFPFDVLQNYATIPEFERLKLKENPSLWTLAFLTNGYLYIPILNFFAAPMIALAFIFFCLGKLSEYRATS